MTAQFVKHLLSVSVLTIHCLCFKKWNLIEFLRRCLLDWLCKWFHSFRKSFRHFGEKKIRVSPIWRSKSQTSRQHWLPGESLCFHPSQKAHIFFVFQAKKPSEPIKTHSLQSPYGWNSNPKKASSWDPQHRNTFPQCLTASPHSLSASPQQGKGIQRRWNPIHRWRASFPQRWNANLQRLNPFSTETTFKLI